MNLTLPQSFIDHCATTVQRRGAWEGYVIGVSDGV
jgi:hypothetical protein